MEGRLKKHLVDPGFCGSRASLVVYTSTWVVMGWGQSPLHQDNIAVQTFILLHIFLEPKRLIPLPTSCTDKGISWVCYKCCTVVNSLHLLIHWSPVSFDRGQNSRYSYWSFPSDEYNHIHPIWSLSPLPPPSLPTSFSLQELWHSFVRVCDSWLCALCQLQQQWSQG